ncbi:MAG: hypothetical protein HQK68_13355 [Desulfamplus sp.]|nr:hypothetical protein [Desulfamplus sp.]
MKRLLVALFIVVITLSFFQTQARADCASVSDDLTIKIASADFDSIKLKIELELYKNSLDSSGLYFKLGEIDFSLLTSSSATIAKNLDITVSCATFQGVKYTLYLKSYFNIKDMDWFYWRLADVGYVNDGGQNRKPVADSLSLNVDSTVPYIVQQLSARDPDNDTITYELVSPTTGIGYSSAYINPSSGRLYLTHVPDGNNSFNIEFRVTDGKLFSDPANVNVSVTYLSDEDKGTGQIETPAEEYARFSLSTLNANLFGTVGEQPTAPRSVDLSANFPNPGDQGNQSSCVGWATAYALKSYQEKVELGWTLNTPSHLFSPAFIYNQINDGQDQGSYIYEALDLAVNKGVATLATMPYSAKDYITQPSAAAFSEALKFKAASWKRVSGSTQIKAALANRKPVVGGITVYQQLMELSGSNSVYNTAYGNNQGGHAITIVGYDDDKYGGAFKVINSWSQNWGDRGFFWMPYSFAADGILSEAYVLEDAKNSENITPEEPTKPEPNYNTLPNLTVINWDAKYDPRPRGAGELTYNIKNTGAAIAPSGVDVNLILSEDREIDTNDYYVIYESIPFELKTGASVFRDANNSISFMFPDNLSSGTYYMALWVDDLDLLEESNEEDNISVGSSKITIENTLPDLEVKTWYANWDSYGNGSLTYEIINSGASSTTSTDWYINLILDSDQVAGNGNETYLFYEQAQFILAPNKTIYRKSGVNPAYFNLYQTYDGSFVPSGTYYMALWVDDMDSQAESNELNNGSYSWGTVSVQGYYATNRFSQADNFSDEVFGSAYNGKKLPTSNLVWKKVEINRAENGDTTLKVIEPETEAESKSTLNQDLEGEFVQAMNEQATDDGKAQPIYSKSIEAASKMIFPTTSSTPMPSK